MKNIFFLLGFLLVLGCGGDQSTTATTEKVSLTEFTNGLDAITATDFTAIPAATELFESFRQQLPNPAIADTLFYPHYWNFYQASGQRAAQKLYNDDPTQLPQIEQTAAEYGFGVKMAESGLQAVPTHLRYLKLPVLPYLSETLKMYVRQVVNQNNLENPNAADIGMNVLFWENFAKNNPAHPLAADAQRRFKAALPQLLVGTATNPFFTEQGLESTYPIVYNQIILKEGDSQVTPILMKYLDVLKANQFKRTAAVDAFLQPYM